MNEDDRVLEALVNLPPIAPDPEWERHVRARCHSALSRRARRRQWRNAVASAAAALALGLYLAAVLREAAHFAGWL